MMYQLTAYQVMGQWSVQLTKMETTDSGHAWAHLIMEHLDLRVKDTEPWDVVWALGNLLCSRAIDAGKFS